ncbi:SDR family NAD(P)-dependent oxidoreductase (plasmid) [Pseudoalteromonas sp. T1lg65]|uniref:SDR family NAD(P)-dependent oxidoreductase n=1 Tax=Pseudoalteromonas sp. T1lg65 TaxID=2077101 RepID=UPI003F7A6DAE
MTVSNETLLVIGANSSIAKAAISLTRAHKPQSQIFSVSRLDTEQISDRHYHFQCDHSPNAIVDVCETLHHHATTGFTKVIICNGVLHGEFGFPEKKLEDLNAQYSQHLFNVNTLVPMQWLSGLLPILSTQKSPCVITALSARVASIGDNRLGGWYSYRASKAALNMMFKSASIELSRRAKHLKLQLFHPGTTDTPLSKPFQSNVPTGKLFTPQYVAEQLIQTMDNAIFDGSLDYVDWQGKTIIW